MKIIHCADLHLDSKMETNLSAAQAKERRMELLLTFEQMVAYAKKYAVDAIIIAGDLFDTEYVSKRTITRVRQIMKETPEIIFYYVPGNHDAGLMEKELGSVPENVKIFQKTWTYYEQGECVITGVQCSAETVGEVLAQLQLEEQQCNIVVLHGQIVDMGYGKYQEHDIPLQMLEGKNIDYLALGHVHSYQSGMLDVRGKWCYAGCMEGRGFDECGEKGFVLLDIVNGQIQSQFVPIADRIFYEIELDAEHGICKKNGKMIQLDKEKELEMLIEEVLSEIEPQHFIKLILKGTIAAETEIDVPYWSKRYGTEHYVLKIEDHTKKKIGMQSYRNDATLKGEFMRTILNAELPPETLQKVMQMGLKALAGEEC